MDEHPNARVFRDAYLAMEKQDLETLRDVLAPDIVWHMVGDEAPIVGSDAVIEALAKDMGEVEFSGDVHDVLANDEHVVALITVHLRRGDRQATYRATDIGHVRDGRLAERWAMVDDFQTMADFWAD